MALELLAAGRRDLVNAHLAVARRHAPLRGQPARLQHALESGIERSLFNLKQIVRVALDELGERVSVERAVAKGLENHHLQGSGKETAVVCTHTCLLEA